MNKKTKWGIIALIGIGLAGMAVHAFLPKENKELAQAPQSAKASGRSRTLNVIGEIIKESTISDGSNRHDLESVREYARMAVIDDTIDSFAEGYDTQIGERGVTISGGQKQRVAIARMLMQNTPIKIFDDSLSAVDMETDAKIRESINNNVRGTTIIIAHRISTIMNADQIIVMDKGRIVQMGTHETLANADGIYKRIYDTQRSAD